MGSARAATSSSRTAPARSSPSRPPRRASTATPSRTPASSIYESGRASALHAKAQGTSHRCNFVATDIFTGKKLEDIVPSTHGTTVPNVFRSVYTLLDITDEDYLSLMDEGGETREDLKMPERPDELVKSIREGFDAGDSLILAVVKAMGEEHIMACKKDTS